MWLAGHLVNIIHRPGKQHGNGDALSHIAVNNIVGLGPIWDRERIKHEQQQDSEIRKIMESLENNDRFLLDNQNRGKNR